MVLYSLVEVKWFWKDERKISIHQIKAYLEETMQLMQKGCGYSTVYSNDLHHVNLTILEITNDYEQNPSSVVFLFSIWYTISGMPLYVESWQDFSSSFRRLVWVNDLFFCVQRVSLSWNLRLATLGSSYLSSSDFLLFGFFCLTLLVRYKCFKVIFWS